jgi:tetratricopeptide (TPR) repeat protein
VTTLTDPDLRFLRGALLHNLGIIQMWQKGTRSNAIQTFQSAIYERQQLLPSEHPDLVASFARKGEACFAIGDLKGAVRSLESALSLTSPDHLVRAKVLNNLGVVYYFERGGKAALKEFIKSLSIQRSWLESTIRRETMIYDVVVTLCNMGKVYLELAECNQSLNAYEEAVLLLTSVFSKDHDMVLSCLSSLALAKSQNGDIDHGIQILQGCLRSQNNRFGEMSAASIETVGLIGYLHAKKGEFGAALKHLSIVQKWQKIHLSPQHQSSLRIKDSIKMLENKLGIVRSPSVTRVWI